jgi:hypothetical protein
MSTPHDTGPAVPAISDAQRIEIARGAERERRFLFARKLASFNGVGVGIFALFALLSAAMDPSSLLLALPLAAIAFVELNGGQRVARYERKGLVQLVCNQVALIALVSIYALVRIFTALDGGSPVNEMLAQSGVAPADLDLSALSAEVGDFDAMYRTAVTAFYSVVIAATALAQGGCALYYYSRLRHLDHFLAETPRWVVEHLRNGGR